MKDFEPQFRLISELQRLGERAFIHKLKKVKPGITSEEIANEVDQWYLGQPNAIGDGFSRRKDTSRFIKKI